MVLEIITFFTVVMFCLACHGLIKTISTSPDLGRLEDFSYRALKFERGYKIFAWSALTLFFFVSLTLICIESFFSL